MILQKYANLPEPVPISTSLIQNLFCEKLIARDLSKEEEEEFLEEFFEGSRSYNPVFEEYYNPHDIELLRTRLKIEKGEVFSPEDTWISKESVQALKEKKLLEFSRFNPKTFSDHSADYALKFFVINYQSVEVRIFEIDLAQAYKQLNKEISPEDLVLGVSPHVSSEIRFETAQKGQKICQSVNLGVLTKIRE